MYESAEPTNFAERVMGTNRDALLAVIEHLKNEARAGRDRSSLGRSSFFVWPTCMLCAVCCMLLFRRECLTPTIAECVPRLTPVAWQSTI